MFGSVRCKVCWLHITSNSSTCVQLTGNQNSNNHSEQCDNVNELSRSKKIQISRGIPSCSLTTYQMCVKPVYRMDPLINLDGAIIHKQCAKCGDCNCQITLSNFVKNEIGDQTSLICKTHYMKRFNEVSEMLIKFIDWMNFALILIRVDCSAYTIGCWLSWWRKV